MACSSHIVGLLILASVYAVNGQVENPCEKGIDLGIIVDRSKSVGKQNFPLVKDALKDFVDNFNISPETTHVSFIFYADTPDHLFNLSDSRYHSNQDVKNRIDRLPNKLIFGTRTDLALMKAHDHLFTANNDRKRRPNVLVVFTDGKTASSSAPYSEVVPPLEDKGVNIIAVGIGKGIDVKELKEIAGSRGSTIEVADFNELEGKLNEILAEVCIINGGYTSWSLWSECSATCGGGSRSRARNCTNPEPMGGGENCDELGPADETEECNTEDCDDSIDGGYTRWTTWTQCSQTCGEGVRRRFRICSNPFPQKDGKSCEEIGPPEETMACNTDPCKTAPKPCDEGIDLGILIDRSTSIRGRNFKRLLTILLPSLFGRLSISKKKTRIGLITYAKEAEVKLTFKSSASKSRKKAKAFVQAHPPRLARQTRTDKGLTAARSQLFSKKGGDRKGRQNVLITFTDGRAYPRKRIAPFTETVTPLTENRNCHMVAIGYGNPSKLNRTQLAEIAGDNVLVLPKPRKLKKFAKKLAKTVCAVDGGYTQWSMWSLCSATCGAGVRVRSRVCSAPPPRAGGKDCTRLGGSYQTQECNDIECPTGPPECEAKKMDVCLIIDTSLSVRLENLIRVKSFIVQLIHQFDPATHFSIITFAGSPVVQCKFSDSRCQTTDGAHDAIADIPDKLSFGTHTDKALMAADDIVFTPEGGNRADADNILFVVTDGKTNKHSKSFNVTVPPLRDGKGVQVMAFGVGPSIREEDLNEMAGEKNWFYVENFDEMSEKLTPIIDAACPEPSASV